MAELNRKLNASRQLRAPKQADNLVKGSRRERSVAMAPARTLEDLTA
jgi:hypothetical protein